MKKAIVAAVLSGVLAGGILVSAGSIMADTTDNSQGKKSFFGEMRPSGAGMRGTGDMRPGFMVKGQGGLEPILDELVADGIITQDKADKTSDFITQKDGEMKAQREEMKDMTQEEREATRKDRKAPYEKNKDRKGGILTELVDEEIITQAEADAVQEKQKEKMENQRQEMMDEQFEEWVADEIISEDQADKIKDFIEAKADERKAQMDELKEMTDEERKTYFEENKDKEKGIKRGVEMFVEMVDEGIISQDQADKLVEKGPISGHIKQRN